MFDVGAIVGRIALNDEFTAPLKEAAKTSTTFREQFQRDSEKVSESSKKAATSILDVSKAMGAIGSAVSAGAIGLAVKSLSDMGAKSEQTYISFKTFLGGSEEATKKLVGAMNDFANVTPFTNDQVLKAGRSLMAFGVGAKDIAPTLKLIGDVSAGTGKDLSEMAVIFGQIRAAGRLQGQDLLQLINAGFNPLQTIAQKTGKSMAQLKAEMERGGISFKMVEQAFKDATSKGGLFANMMEQQSHTFAGLMSTLEGTAQTLGADIGRTLNDALKPALEIIVGLADRLMRGWQALAPETKQTIVTFGGILTAAVTLTLALPALALAVQAVGAAFTAAFVANPIGPIILAIAAAAASVVYVMQNWAKFKVFMDPLVQAFHDVKAAVVSIATALGGAWADQLKGIFGAFDNGAKGVDLFATAIKAVISPVVVLVVTVSGAISTLKALISGLIDNLGNLGNALKEVGILAASMAGPTGLVGLANWAATGGAERMQTAFSALGQGMSKPLDDTLKRMDETGAKIKTVLSDIVTKSTPGATAKDVALPGAPDLKEGPAGGGHGREVGTTLAREFAKGWGEGLAALGTSMFGPLSAMTKDNIKEMEAMGKLAAQTVTQVFQAVIQNMNLAFDLAKAKISNAIKQLDFLTAVSSSRMKAAQEEELAALEETENAKIDVLKRAQVEKLALIDQEFAAKKAAADAEFEAKVETERVAFEERLAQLEQGSADQEQAALARQVMEEDWRLYVQNLQSQHDSALLAMESDRAAKSQTITNANSAAVTAAEQNKTDALKALKDKQAADEKKAAKDALFAKTVMEYQAYEVSKKQSLMAAQITLAMTLLAAVQAGANIAAIIPPPVGIVLGASTAAALAALAMGTYGMAVGAIQAAKFVPPAALFAEQGGTLVGGNRHALGGVNVNAERGETILSRGLTSSLESYLQINDQRPDVKPVFQPGSIVVQGNMDSGMVDRLSDAIALRIQQRAY